MFTSLTEWGIAALAAVFIGISKAGFGGGTGILATPLMALAVPPHLALGTLLPLLIVGDLASCWLYRGAWQWKPLGVFLPGCLGGVLLGTLLLGQVHDGLLKQILGAICLGFCLLQWVRARQNTTPAAVRPGWLSGTGFGLGCGVTSTLAHAAGPVFAMYLLPMQLPQRAYMATTVLAFTLINLIKLPGYLTTALITPVSLRLSLALAVFVLAGTWIGEWLNRHCSPAVFRRVVYLVLFLSGLELISGKSLLRSLWAFATACS